MLSGLLIILDILVCIALVGVVLLQRSEGGAFGMGGGPTGLITARGAGDLLTRTTWVLFGVFLALSIGLTLLGAHDRASSSVIERLKLQQANPNALSQPVAPAPTAPLTAPAPTVPGAGQGPVQGAPLMAPPPAAAPQAAPAATPAAAGRPPAAAAGHAAHQRKPAATAPAAPALEAPAPQPAAPPVLDAPPPQPAPATQP
ncbi:MAG TPA: preprotein translocase subunit SecG [Caulobacteraceae bacterium]|nr:preprotein translocase subunit SecG [Caulobacteraceae bacterium]